MRKLSKYNDPGLLFFIVRNVILVAITPANRRLQLVPEEIETDPGYSEEKVVKYVRFVYFLMKRLGIRPGCYNGSIGVCRIFRKKGIDARIVFGCAFDKEKLKGHCWVETGEDALPKKFQPVFSYSGEIETCKET